MSKIYAQAIHRLINNGETNITNEFKKEISFVPYLNGLKNGFEFPGLSDFPQ